jgi:hypothetical protein
MEKSTQPVETLGEMVRVLVVHLRSDSLSFNFSFLSGARTYIVPLLFLSPSPISSFRKRLPSIEENGWNVILAKANVGDSDEDNEDIKKDSNCDFHDDNHDVDDDDDNVNDSFKTQKEFSHVQVSSDEMPALTTNSWMSTGGRRSALAQAERIAHFEREQRERFHRQKEDIGKKLGNVLDRNLTTVRQRKIARFRAMRAF